MCSANLAPDHARTSLFAAAGTVDIRDALAEIPLRVLRAIDAFEREEAHVGVRVAFAALVADMAGFDIYCTNYYYVYSVIPAAVTYDDGSFRKTLRLIYLLDRSWIWFFFFDELVCVR
jgi:hypothetical protein